ncbi:MAG: transporter permease, partial [Daejeonella sp.]|nr:transporter permease [Daejeonella sp.]
MLKHYFITVYRNLLKRKLFTLINLVGLSVGMATFLVLISYVTYEFSYDTYLSDSKQIYRVDYYEYQHGETVLKNSRSHTGLSTYLKQNFPEVNYVAKAYNEECLLFNDRAKAHQKGIWVDSTFLNVFKVKLLEGSRDKALTAPFSMAISKSLANTYFGKQSPIGKVLYFNEHVPFMISAVFEDVPANSSVKFNFLVSMTTLFKLVPDMKPEGDFGGPWVFTYVVLNKNVTDVTKLNASLKTIANENISSLKQRNLTGEYRLRPVSEIHFSQDMTGELEPGKTKVLLHALISVAIFILLAAWINYINLSMAQSFQRAEEIMVRKVYGASVFNISSQFLAEAAIISVVAAFSGFTFYRLLVNFLSVYLSADFAQTQQYHSNSIWFVLAIIIITMLSAMFPAKVIAKYNPAFILKKQYNNGSNKNLLRNGLVIFQLFLSIFTIGCTIVAYKQINYMRHFDTGFDEGQT